MATTESSEAGGGAASAVIASGAAQHNVTNVGLSPNRPHPERMPEGPPLTRTLDPVDPAVAVSLL